MKFTFLFTSIFLVASLEAQNKISYDFNIGFLHPIGNDIVKTYRSNIQPLTVQYFSREKFVNPYYNLLVNFDYHINPKILIGLQSGIYNHLSERYFGYTKSSISAPVMATAKIYIMNGKKNKFGIYIAGGKNFFNIKVHDDVIKNGALLNGSLFYTVNKSIIKLGIEKQIDNGYIYYNPSNPFGQKETFKYKINRLSVALSYGFIIKNTF
jgi:hypothetical protein